MIGNFSCLINIYSIEPIMVGMANGNASYALRDSEINLSLTLYDVLYLPGLNCNLIPTMKLINDFLRIVAFILSYV